VWLNKKVRPSVERGVQRDQPNHEYGRAAAPQKWQFLGVKAAESLRGGQATPEGDLVRRLPD